MYGRGATTGPVSCRLFAHKRRYYQDQQEVGVFQLPSSVIDTITISSSTSSPSWSINNQLYLDTRNNVCHVGHCHPRHSSRRVKTTCTTQHQLTIFASQCESIGPMVGCQVSRSATGSSLSQSEANDLSLRLARAYTKSKNTTVVDGAYHGHTLTALEVSSYKYQHWVTRDDDILLQCINILLFLFYTHTTTRSGIVINYYHS